MFIRFRQTSSHLGHRLQLSIVETRRIDGRIKHEQIASLGSIVEPQTVRARLEFWSRLHPRFAKLGNRVSGEAQGKLLGVIHARVPMVTLDEQTAVKRANAEADQRFWSGLRDMHAESVEGFNGMIKNTEQAIVQGQAGMAEASAQAVNATERVARLDRGEDVPGGLLDKPMTHKEWLKAVGWTEADLRHARSLGVLDKAGLSDALRAEILRRSELVKKSTVRAFLKTLVRQVAT